MESNARDERIDNPQQQTKVFYVSLLPAAERAYGQGLVGNKNIRQEDYKSEASTTLSHTLYLTYTAILFSYHTTTNKNCSGH